MTWSPDGTERAFVFSIIFVVCLVVGATIRWLIGHAGRSHTELALLDKHIQAIRRDEREALADELSGTLADDLRATGQLLENPLGLAEIDERARSSLTRLRRLVSTLRAEPEATQRHSGNLLGALEEAEDFLVGHGFPVELQTTEAAVLPSDLDIGALLVALREASDHIRLHCAGGVAHIALATAPDGAILTVTHRAEDAESPGWTHTCHLSTRAASAPTSATADPPRRPLLTRVGLTTVRWVLTAPAVIAAVPWLVGALDPSAPQAERGLSLAWAAAFLALALATWMPRVAVSLMATTALASIVALSAPPTFSAFDILGVFLASVVATKWPRALAAIPVGTALCAAWWYRDPADPLPIFAAAVFPAFGAALGLGVRHFLRLRAEHLAEYERLKDAYNTARANERAQLAGELHDIVAHQLSLMTMVLMAHGSSEDPADTAATQERLRRLNASAQADLATLVSLTRHGPTRTSEAGVAPSEAAQATAATLRNAGHTVDLRLTDSVDDPDPTTRRTISRILREATTNILRYAPPESPVIMGLSSSETTLDIAVSSLLPTSSRPSRDSMGFGLIGLAERTSLTGGTFSAGPIDDRWVVSVGLPRTPPPPADRGPVAQPPSGGSRRGSIRPIWIDRTRTWVRELT